MRCLSFKSLTKFLRCEISVAMVTKSNGMFVCVYVALACPLKNRKKSLIWLFCEWLQFGLCKTRMNDFGFPKKADFLVKRSKGDFNSLLINCLIATSSWTFSLASSFSVALRHPVNINEARVFLFQLTTFWGIPNALALFIRAPLLPAPSRCTKKEAKRSTEQQDRVSLPVLGGARTADNVRYNVTSLRFFSLLRRPYESFLTVLALSLVPSWRNPSNIVACFMCKGLENLFSDSERSMHHDDRLHFSIGRGEKMKFKCLRDSCVRRLADGVSAPWWWWSHIQQAAAFLCLCLAGAAVNNKNFEWENGAPKKKEFPVTLNNQRKEEIKKLVYLGTHTSMGPGYIDSRRRQTHAKLRLSEGNQGNWCEWIWERRKERKKNQWDFETTFQ